MKNTQSTQRLLLLALVLVVGCIGPAHHADPLPSTQGWRRLMGREYVNLDSKIVSDYRDYIQNLPAKERNQLTESSIHFFGNTNGQHAVMFETDRDGFLTKIVWAHVLIYDVNDARMKTMHYRSRRSQS